MLNNDEYNVERSDEILEKTHCCTRNIYIAIFTFSGIMN